MVCLKLRGPKTETRLASLRPLPPSIDMSLPVEERLLIYAASQRTDTSNLTINDIIIFHLCSGYEPAIPNTCLRFAILAISAISQPNAELNERGKLYYHRARAAVTQKVDSGTGFGRAEVFATHILGTIAWQMDDTRTLCDLRVALQIASLFCRK